jgi:Domain of unknown function (DUF5666)
MMLQILSNHKFMKTSYLYCLKISMALVALIPLCFVLTSCAELAKTDLTANVCETRASLINPNSSLGGTSDKFTKNSAGENGGNGGIGGTGVIATNKKIKFDNSGNSGNSGVGGIGGTGIVGVITGFASICVNGIEVHFDVQTPVSDNGQTITLKQLEVGQVVSVTAFQKNAQSVAKNIAVIHALVGPISEIDVEKNKLSVMGQKVTAMTPSDIATLRLGDWVKVSGNRLANGDVMASRVDGVPVSTAIVDAQVRGSIKAIQGKMLKVGDVTIYLGTLATLNNVAVGQEVSIRGTISDNVLQAKEIAIDPILASFSGVDHVVLEGYVNAFSKDDMTLGSQTLKLKMDSLFIGVDKSKLLVNQRVQISGHIGLDKRITVERIESSRLGSDGGRSGMLQGRPSESMDMSGKASMVNEGRMNSSTSTTSMVGSAAGMGTSGGMSTSGMGTNTGTTETKGSTGMGSSGGMGGKH